MKRYLCDDEILSAAIHVLCVVLKNGNVDGLRGKSNFMPVCCMKAYGAQR